MNTTAHKARMLAYYVYTDVPSYSLFKIYLELWSERKIFVCDETAMVNYITSLIYLPYQINTMSNSKSMILFMGYFVIL